ncbi:NUDIX domain-containing protein [Pleurostoma richardsiae]|uniref:NAD(+) diphosphatase n=1 Tax=Pleurostoma richardsiae TaxID=41990 RepID=A0AA38S2H1_9PEZI|nr:NUDIX domain-containing protein [Pleurostoma richardsiae]
MGSIPDLPVLEEDDSMLSRKFGREVANYFSGSPLNRVSFLRTDHAFLRSAFSHPSTAFLLLNDLAPLVDSSQRKLAYVTSADVSSFTGPDPFEKAEADMIKDFNSEVSHPLILLLGVDDANKIPSRDPGPPFQYKDYKGRPFFAIDITPRGVSADVSNSIIDALKEKGFSFNTNTRNLSLGAAEAAMYGQARALIDWNARNPFCAQCGQRTLSVNAGTKRVCPPTDLAGGKLHDREPCATRKGVSNLSFPRTDPTIIVSVVNSKGTHMLLGRQRRWPPHWYSTLAGFLEPGESIEEATRREVWEESGVRLGRVVLHSSQPWPFPASLMIGAIAQALPGDGETIHLGHDPELEDAKWFPVEEVRDALKKGVSGLGEGPPEGYKEGSLRLPPQTAIANRLMTAVVEGYLGTDAKI